MEPLATLLGDFEPQCVVELGRTGLDAEWARPAGLEGSSVVLLDDRAGLAAQPARLAAELDGLVAPVDVFVDHATADVRLTVRVLEVALGRLAPGGAYVVHGVLPSDVVLDLVFASVMSPELIDGVSVLPTLVVIRRGSAEPSPVSVRLDDLRSDPFEVIPR